jgi:hypothetical protein
VNPEDMTTGELRDYLEDLYAQFLSGEAWGDVNRLDQLSSLILSVKRELALRGSV